jgi:hypothetical protein
MAMPRVDGTRINPSANFATLLPLPGRAQGAPVGAVPGVFDPGRIARVTGHDVPRQAPTEPGRVKGPCAVVGVRAGQGGPIQKPTLRFNKYDGPAVAFPLTEAGAKTLSGSNAVSPFVATNPRVKVHPAAMPPPTHPGDPAYWPELEKVLDMQLARANGGSVEALLGDRTPKLFAGYTLEQAAEAVHADLPSDWPTALFKQLLKEGAKFDAKVVPQLCQADFVNTLVTTAGVLGMATAAVSPSAFACKWHEGRARPEESIWAIRRGELAGVPPELKAKVDALAIGKAEDFTAYPEGAPRHPSWPAMHSAASISSMVLGVLLDLTPAQLAEARNMDYAVATFRTVAGVHFETDNLAGLKIGQLAIEAWLPDFLAEYAGADPEAVRAKMAKIKYDWDQHPKLVAPQPQGNCQKV